jgi:hypothetical protein
MRSDEAFRQGRIAHFRPTGFDTPFPVHKKPPNDTQRDREDQRIETARDMHAMSAVLEEADGLVEQVSYSDR